MDKLCYIHIIENCSAVKKKKKQNTGTGNNNVDEPWKYYIKSKKPDMKTHVLFDSIHMKYSDM